MIHTSMRYEEWLSENNEERGEAIVMFGLYLVGTNTWKFYTRIELLGFDPLKRENASEWFSDKKDVFNNLRHISEIIYGLFSDQELVWTKPMTFRDNVKNMNGFSDTAETERFSRTDVESLVSNGKSEIVSELRNTLRGITSLEQESYNTVEMYLGRRASIEDVRKKVLITRDNLEKAYHRQLIRVKSRKLGI